MYKIDDIKSMMEVPEHVDSGTLYEEHVDSKWGSSSYKEK